MHAIKSFLLIKFTIILKFKQYDPEFSKLNEILNSKTDLIIAKLEEEKELVRLMLEINKRGIINDKTIKAYFKI